MKKILKIALSLLIILVACIGIYNKESISSFLYNNYKSLTSSNSSNIENNSPNIAKARDNIKGEEEPYPFVVDKQGVNNSLKQDLEVNSLNNFIYMNRNNLPDAQKKLLVNHADAKSYIVGYLTGERVPFELGETVELKRQYPYYIQWDRRWAYNELGADDIAIGGCGPTVVAMALGGLLNDESITPDKIADIENKTGYYTPAGTSWDFFPYIAKRYGLQCDNFALSRERLDNALANNNPVIASVIPGKFTTVGHIILIIGKDSQGNYIINDPNSYTRTLKTWSYDELKTEIRTLWQYSK